MAGDSQAVQVAQDPPPPPPPPEPPPTPKRWYGWQLLVAYAPIDFALAWGAYFALQKELKTAWVLLERFERPMKAGCAPITGAEEVASKFS